MSSNGDNENAAFQTADFEVQLSILAIEYQEPVRELFQALSRLEYLQEQDTFLNETGPLVVSGRVVKSGRGSQVIGRLVSIAIPFTDRHTGICLRFALNFPPDGSRSVAVTIERQGAVDVADQIDLWNYAAMNSLGCSWDDAWIPVTEDSSAAITRVLGLAAGVLTKYCDSIVSGELWPGRFAELVQLPSDEEFVDRVRLLSSLSVVDQNGRTLLINAIHAGNPERLKLLLEMGSDPNYVCTLAGYGLPAEERGYAALHHLMTAIHLETAVALELAEMLCRHGAKLDTESHLGATPLGLASRMVWTECVRFLLQAGARQLGKRWCDTWNIDQPPYSIQVRILDQILKSALGLPSQLKM